MGRSVPLRILAERFTSAATTRARPHTLLVGPRGAGKTHLLKVAVHRLGRQPEVAACLAVAEINEDAIGITRYTDLLFEIGAALNLGVSRSADAVATENAILDGIGDRTLVLVLENLDRLFRSIGTAGQRNLRSWVETSGRVLVLAATPALFAGVSERTEPWFAGLITTPVEGLSALEGRELLTILAQRSGDDELAAELRTERGLARVRAVARLAGGSPRIWMVLAECLTVESLDSLVPAVEQLVEDLVPYYQQLLWDLPDNQQSVIRQLADSASVAWTVAGIARATGLSQQTVSKALSLLQEGHWVRAQKIGSDRRHTWYQLREPMLRHHFQWRAGGSQPLTLLVELLRAWYTPSELRHQLAGARPGSQGEFQLAQSLAMQSVPHDRWLWAGNADEMLAEARRWAVGGDEIFSPECGKYAELCLLLSEDPELDLRDALARRPRSDDDDRVCEALGEKRGAELDELMIVASEAAGTPRTRAGLVLAASGRIGAKNAQRAAALLQEAQDRLPEHDALYYAVCVERVCWTSAAGDPGAALRQGREFLSRLQDDLGPDHPTSLKLRSNIALSMGEVGDAAGALELYRALLADRERLGADEGEILSIRGQVAFYTGRVGDAAGALELCRGLLADCERVFGADDRSTLLTRELVALATRDVGDVAGALELYQELLADRERVLGADDRDTLSIREQVAFYTGEVGDAAGALELYQELLADRERVLGADDHVALDTRAELALRLATAGRADQALALVKSHRSRSGFELLIAAFGPEPPTEPDVAVAFWHAVRGDIEARVKLPLEMTDIVDRLRKRFPK